MMGSSRQTLFTGSTSVFGLRRSILGASHLFMGLACFHRPLDIAPEKLANPLRPTGFSTNLGRGSRIAHPCRGQVRGGWLPFPPPPSAARP